jgi:acyl carrier protein
MPADELLRQPRDARSAADIDARLERVFAATFPDLPADAIRSASVDTLEIWDSLQSVVLITLLEEEFVVSISPFDLADLTSYESVREYLLAPGADSRPAEPGPDLTGSTGSGAGTTLSSPGTAPNASVGSGRGVFRRRAWKSRRS